MKWGTHVTEFAVALPRQVYCPGDTVCGELHLSTDAPMECRGLHVRLEHKSVVHWHDDEIGVTGKVHREDYHNEAVRGPA